MSNALLPGQTEIPDEVIDDEIDPQILSIAKRINDRVKNRVHTPYRKAILARLQAPNQNALPPMTYQSYKVVYGQHSHFAREDVAECEKLNRGRSNKDLLNPRESNYGPGDTFTPQSDGEALMVDQDPNKYQPIGVVVGSEQAGAADLLAEINRLKANEAAKDAEMKELQKQLDEIRLKLPAPTQPAAAEKPTGNRK